MQDYFNCLVIISLVFFILTQNIGNAFGQNQEDLIRITGDFLPDKYSDTEIGFSGFDLIKFSVTYTNGSRLCPNNNCIFQFQGGNTYQDPSSADTFFFNGVLRVGTQDTQESRYRVYNTLMIMYIIETIERPGAAIHTVTGTIYFGETQKIEYEIYDGTLTVGGGYVQLDVYAKNPLLS